MCNKIVDGIFFFIDWYILALQGILPYWFFPRTISTTCLRKSIVSGIQLEKRVNFKAHQCSDNLESTFFYIFWKYSRKPHLVTVVCRFSAASAVRFILRFVSSYELNAHFLYSITIYVLRYDPRHVSSSTLLIFRRTNCIITASGIITLCKRLYSMPVYSCCQPAEGALGVRRA